MADSRPDSIDPVDLTRRLKVVEAQQKAEKSVADSLKKITESKASAQEVSYPPAAETKIRSPTKEAKPKNQQPPHPMKTRNRPSQQNTKPPTSHPKNLKSPPVNEKRPYHTSHRSLFLNLEDRDESPDSQVIASGDCSPGSEGVRRKDRVDVHHWPGHKIASAELTPESRRMLEVEHGV